jgi:hypothetical protein
MFNIPHCTTGALQPEIFSVFVFLVTLILVHRALASVSQISGLVE